MGKNFRETPNEQLKDPGFKAEWDALVPERQKMQTAFESTLTQEEIEQNFRSAIIFDGIMSGLDEALRYKQGIASSETIVNERALPPEPNED